jgi:exonuclease SbcC
MKLKKITLNNIRSYKNQEIIFPEGSTLLSGDIGSGKTSILLAIEFALFGLQPGQRGSSLLRSGEPEGGATIEFEIEGSDVIIQRTLKRGKKSISQNYCSIMIDDIIKEVSVTELKSIVLDLLNYPKEFAKKQNILYKFTVYTPQEEMKQIILQDPVTRLNTLRHVFGIDKYKRILENTSILTSKLREEKRYKEALTSTLEQDREKIISKENELETKRYNLVSIEKELFLKKETREKIQEEKQEMSEKIEEKNKLQSEIDKTKLMVSTKKDSIINNSKLITKLLEQLKELESIKIDDSEIPNLENELSSLKKQKQELNEKNLDISSQINSYSLKNQDNEDLKNKISGMTMCPTCLQDVNPVHKSNVVNKVETDITENTKKIEFLITEKRSISEKLSEINNKINSVQNKIQELKVLKIKLENFYEKETRIKELEENNTSLEKDIQLLNQHLNSLKNSVFELNKYDNLFEQKKKEFEEAFKEERLAEIKVAELKKEIDMFENQIQELKKNVKKLEKIKLELNYISNIENWLNKSFSSLIANIERNVMVKLRNEFSTLFSQWFSMLVSGDFNVRLDDEFTPIIEQHDYELDYNYLSGGERTAIALAYRLSLNQVINSILSKIKTKGVVILDEPTDGFSDPQLDKMREVLEELDVSQLIIVSHEQKIEGFVENVIKLSKDTGISKKA